MYTHYCCSMIKLLVQFTPLLITGDKPTGVAACGEFNLKLQYIFANIRKSSDIHILNDVGFYIIGIIIFLYSEKNGLFTRLIMNNSQSQANRLTQNSSSTAISLKCVRSARINSHESHNKMGLPILAASSASSFSSID